MNLKNDERGSLSIFAAICIPFVIIGALILYKELNQIREKNQVLKIATYVSEAQKAHNNAYLFEHFGIVGYKTIDTFDQSFYEYFKKNRLSLPKTVEIEEHTLDKRIYFAKAIQEASKYMISASLLDSMTSFDQEMEESILTEEVTDVNIDDLLEDIDSEEEEPPEEVEKVENLKERFASIKYKKDESIEKETWHKVKFDEIQSTIEKDWSLTDQLLVKEFFMSVFRSLDLESPRSMDPLNQKVKRDKDLVAEIEYLLVGKGTDSQNINEIKLRLFVMREATNMAHLLSDSEKMQAINQWTLLIKPPWNFLVKASIIILWTGVESHLDVKMLLDGKGLSFIKNKDEWHLSLNNLLNGKWDSDDSKSSSNQKNKWYYQDYLRTMIYAQDTTLTVSRAMALFEKNIRTRTYDLYGLKDFSIGHKVRIQCKDNVSIEFEN